MLRCIEHDLTETEALRCLLQKQRPSSGLNDFIRICLALDLEPFLREKAQANQQAGGQNKGSSNLTEADRVDVRSEIANLAGVGTGNVTKVKQLLATAQQPLLRSPDTATLTKVQRSCAFFWSWINTPPSRFQAGFSLRIQERSSASLCKTLLPGAAITTFAAQIANASSDLLRRCPICLIASKENPLLFQAE
jgi:hypothetical protein